MLVFAEMHVGWAQILYILKGSVSLSDWIQICLSRSRSLKAKNYGSLRSELSVSQSELWQNLSDLITLILHLWMRYYVDRSFKKADFQTKKCVREP
jgi:hypothetical protein